jgi:hypothetical protein
MKKKPLLEITLFIFFFFSFSHSASAIGELTARDARSFALGNLHALSWEAINPAFLSFQTTKQLSASILNQFEIKELSTIYLRGQYPNDYLNAGLSFSHYGYEDYRIIQAQVGLSKKIVPKLSIGINLLYYQQSSLWEEDIQHYLSSGIGIYYQLNSSIGLAFLADNVLHTFPGQCWNIYAGMSYEALENCFLFVETSYGAIKPFDLSLGVEYKLVEELKVRAGTQIILKTPSFGVGYQWNKWTIDAGFSLHPVLGITSIIGFNYRF